MKYQAGYQPPPTTHLGHDAPRLDAVPGDAGLAEALLELQQLTERLRRDCPWDREQTARTIVPHTVEEAYEVADAARAGDDGEAGRRARRPALPGLLPRAAARGAGRGRPRGSRARRPREARPPAPARLRRRRGADGRPRARALGADQDRARRGASGVFHDVPESLPALLYARKVQRRASSRSASTGRTSRAARQGRARSCASSRTRSSAAASRSRRPSPTRGSSTRSATCSSRSSTSRAGSTSIPELALRATIAQVPRARRAGDRAGRGAQGERWAGCRSTSRTRYYELAKEALR